jgi:hypothetical protein
MSEFPKELFKMSDPESPTFNRKPFSLDNERFDDANYWRLPIDELDFQEETRATRLNDSAAINTEIGINGTLRGFKKPTVPPASMPKIFESELRRVEGPPTKHHVIPMVEPIVSEAYSQTSVEIPIQIAVDEEMVVKAQPSYRSFENVEAVKERYSYRLFDGEDRDAIISIFADPAQFGGQRSVLSREAVADIPGRISTTYQPVVHDRVSNPIPVRVSGISQPHIHDKLFYPVNGRASVASQPVIKDKLFSPVASNSRINVGPQPAIKDRLLSPVVSNTTLGSKSPRESTVSKPEVQKKFDKQDLDYNKSEENLKKRFYFKWIMVFRSLVMSVHTWLTVYPGLDTTAVVSLGGKNLLISILAFSMLDLILAIIKAWPKRFWIFWRVQEWNPVNLVVNLGKTTWKCLGNFS